MMTTTGAAGDDEHDAIDVQVQEIEPYEFEITLESPLAMDIMETQARMDNERRYTIAPMVGVPLMMVYEKTHGRMPDLGGAPAVAGDRERRVAVNRYILPIDNPVIRRFLDGMCARRGISRSEPVKFAVIAGLRATFEMHGGTSPAH